MPETISAAKFEKLKKIVTIMIEGDGDRRPVYTDTKEIKVVNAYISGERCPVYLDSMRRNTISKCKQCQHCEFGKMVVHHIEIPKGFLSKDINIQEGEFELLFGTKAACWIKIEEGELKWIPMFGFGERKPWWKPLTAEEAKEAKKKWGKSLLKLFEREEEIKRLRKENQGK